jgi:hypothetical protein
VLCALLALLPGCSMLRVGYGQAPDLVYWWLDGYADFNDLQTPRVRDALAQWFAWNRKTQLGDYAALLARAELDVQANSTPERACAYWGEVMTRVETAVDRAVPAAADIMLTLTPAQIQHLERRYAKSNDEFRSDYLQKDAARRLRESVKRTVERVEMLYGSIDDAQLARVTSAVAASPFDPDLWLAERERRQQDALQMLRRLAASRATPEQAQSALRAYVRRYLRSPRDGYRNYADRLLEYNCAFGAAVHNAMSPAQRQVAVERLKAWEGDLRSLAGDAAP